MIEFNTPQLTAPGGSIIGVIEEGRSHLSAPTIARLGPDDSLPQEPGNFILDYPLSKSSAVARSRAISHLVDLRRAGATLVLVSHDEPLLEKCADEIWWLRDGALVARGDPADVLPLYRRYVAAALRKAGNGIVPPLAPPLRNGDGRAVLESIELAGEDGQPSTVWRSGETVSIGVTVRYTSDVADPVIGVLIRTRIGLNVYGTNTELEHLHVGPVAAGDRVRVTYRFRADLCPGDYTITAASHDPDGLWHNWQEDAVAFAVSDSRYTAGVANLRAQVYAEVTRAQLP
ncbi:MAG: Wzt carbohydrate-binding domain-containing protein [Bryobacteraceae bacterium]|jgi:lipopolysaccharide transport system ATP-binding protein